MNPFKRLVRSQESGATPTSVAETLRSKDPEKIRSVMAEHRIYALPDPQSTQRYEVHDITNASGEYWRPGRTLGWLRPHRVRTFELRVNESPQDVALRSRATGRELDATYVPMTQAKEWGGTLKNVGTALGQTRTADVGEGQLGVTGELTGCSLLRLKNGAIGHLQPPRMPEDESKPRLVGERAEGRLRKQSTVESVFGPSEYGRVKGATHEHDRTNTIMIGGASGAPTQVVSQSLFITNEITTDMGTQHMRKINTQFGELK